MPNRPPRYQPPRRPGEAPPRPSAAARGYDGQWRRFRAAYLRRHPLCADCLEGKRAVEATEIVAIRAADETETEADHG